MSKHSGKIACLLALAAFTAIMMSIRSYCLANGKGFSPWLFFEMLIVGGVLILVSVLWAHTRGKKWLKATLLALVGFSVGGVAGGFAGEMLRPHHPDDIGEIAYLFGGFWIGGLLVGIFAARWVVRFHRQYAAEPIAATDRGERVV